MMQRRVRCGALTLAALTTAAWAVACSPTDPPAPDARPPLAAELVGRRALVFSGDRLLPAFDADHALRVRFRGPAPPLDAHWLAADGRIVPLASSAGEAIDGAERVTLIPLWPPAAGPGQLTLVAGDGRAATLDGVWLDWPEPPVGSPHAEAEAATRSAIEASRRGDTPAAIDGMLDASAAWMQAGRPTDAMACLGAAGHYARHRRMHDHAARFEAWIAALNAVVDDDETRSSSAYRLALVDMELGRFQAAEQGLEAAIAGMRSLGRSRHARVGRLALANLYEMLGRYAEALAIHEAMPISATDPADAFRARVNRAWIRLQAMRAGAIEPDYPAIRQRLADESARLPADISPASAANLQTNLALAALLAGAVPEARAALAEARRLDPEGGGLWPAFLDLLEGEVALAEGHASAALTLFERAAARARREVDDGDSIEAWQALYGQGRALKAAGRVDEAVGRWRSALAMTRRLAGRTSLSSSHSAFLADRRALVDDLVTALLDRGAVAEAFRAMDAARAPTLRALAADARLDGLAPAALAEWQRRVSAWGAARRAVDVAESELTFALDAERAAALERLDDARRAARRRFDEAYAWLDSHAPLDAGDPGEPTALVPADTALISLFELRGRWHGFLVVDGRVEHRPAIDPDAPLGPWRATLRNQRRIYVIDGGLPAARTLAERPIDPGDPDGATWGERVELAWLPFAGWLRRGVGALPDGPPVVVADPDGTLPGSRAAAVAIARRAGLAPLVGEAATRQAVLDRLDGARWFHFDGHGVIGRGEPWQAHLRMARDEVLTLADVLATRPRVGTVVLSGCETGVPEALSRAESMGLAEGFLLAGAAHVVAADRVLGVDEAARFVEAFHRAGGAERPAAAMRATIADMRRSGDDAWRGWRVFGVPLAR